MDLGGLNGVEARVRDGETYAGRSGLGRGVGDVIGASTIPLEGKTGQNAAGEAWRVGTKGGVCRNGTSYN